MASPVQVGDIVAGKYRVDAVVGHGGMGVVVAATDTILERRVAVKFLLPQYAESPVASGRFLREARATARLSSQHTIRIIEVGQLPTGSPFMAMEFLEGVDLGTLVERQGALDVRVAVDYVLQATRGLAEAHQAGIVHRDVKPSNLFLSYQPSGKPVIKVLDFGVSKLSLGLDGAGSLTTTGQTLGSPLYMAPEQMRSSQTADVRSDVWGLGVVLFELLTGARPFVADSLAELVLVITQDPPTDPQRLRPDLPPGLCQIILRCLEKDPNRRYGNVLDLGRDLASFGWSDTLRTAEVDLTPSPQAGHHGTLIVAGDHPDVARLAQMAEAVLGPSRASVHPSIAPAPEQRPSSPVGSKSSSPWSSTNDEPKTEARKRHTGIVWALVAATGLVLAGALFFLLRGPPEEAPNAALESVASELARIAPEQPAATSDSFETASPMESTAPLASSAPNIGVTVPSVGTSERESPGPPTEAPKKPLRRPRSDEPRSAKERLGF